MNPIEALAKVLAAVDDGSVKLPRCEIPNGPDVGAEFAVALAMVSGLLPACRTVNDVVAAAHLAAEECEKDEALYDVVVEKTVSLLEVASEAGRRLEVRRIAENN